MLFLQFAKIDVLERISLSKSLKGLGILCLYSLLAFKQIKCILGIHIINLRKTWEKLVLAARIIAGVENPEDVCVISSRPYGTVRVNFCCIKLKYLLFY